MLTVTLGDIIAAAGQLIAIHQADEAIGLYRNWLAVHGDAQLAYVARFNLGVLLGDKRDSVGAEEQNRLAIAQAPMFMPPRLNLGTQLEQQGRKEEALAEWRQVTELITPELSDNRALLIRAYNNLGRLLEILHRYPEAESMLRRSLALDPDQPDAISHWVHLRQKQCSWPAYQAIEGITMAALIKGTSALATLSACSDPAGQLAASRTFVEKKVLHGVAPLSDDKGYAHKKLRIGYMSSDFCAHAVTILTAELFELHDRSQVELYGFCWSREDGTPMRARVVKALDNYVPIGAMSDEEAAKCIRSHEIDILVDLQGLTSGTRPNILSYRPAPVQVTYLGFPGPTALPEVDYVIADRFVLPEELRPYFTEQPLYMPRTFQINDRRREIGPKPTRAECKLPEDGFVFCSFNNSHKITPEVFGSWMRILTRVPGSVLWLVADGAEVRANLSREAEARGVDASRLHFAERVTPTAYLARYQVADLFLDTAPFNAGTTASDALWAGLPLLTCAGRTFASRMAGSLLHAADLPELVTFNLQDYENLAVDLATHPERIAAMKQQLADNRMSCALFDSPQFVRDLEEQFRRIAKRPAGQIAIDAGRAAPPHPMQLPALEPLAPEQQSRVLSFVTRTVWGLTDPAKFYAIMEEALKLVVPGYFLGDNLMTWGRNNSMFDDAAFRESWQANAQNDADRAIAWRRYVLACAAYHCAQLPGDFVECGVYRGTGVKTIVDYFGKKGFTKTFWAYDTFDYNPVEHHAFVGQEGEGLFADIQQRFAGYDCVRLVRGLLPASLEGNSPDKISYLHIDLNSAEFEIAVLEALFDRVVPGGIVVLDDYEWAGIYRPQKMAEDAWFEQRSYRVFPLPTGQGLILKR